MKKLNIIFCGTPDFSVPALEMLFNHPHVNLSHVITMPDRPAGRGQKLQSPPVAEFAKASKISLIQTENINREEEILNKLEGEKVDAIVVLAFAQFLGSRILNLPKLGCFNIHTSLLPKYRGAAPIQYALLNGDKESGVSIQRMVKQMDAGDLVHSYPMQLDDNETGGQLYTRLKFQAALSLNTVISELLNNKITYTPQDHDAATFAPTLKKEDGFLDFSNKTIEEIHNQVRALIPWPGTWCKLNEKRLKVFSVEKSLKSISPGACDTKDGNILIGCSNGTLRLSDVQIEGKKRCSDTSLINGMKNSTTDFTIN
ncbi:methionyl-tRNA formyltransferase [Halobacteriovorax marinus]|uniref:methionyl-tRNA formyltransferase n=1 Tax=Halobacteriovorax marinus TaxID=97084 RepID=UPI000BC2F676|nr:methionyl-tRNA formyltransferase [Halobacteriovorax marinus]ATH09421.1 methionyl-tRNA formyltransferase [Halobacteriovorax marinus]